MVLVVVLVVLASSCVLISSPGGPRFLLLVLLLLLVVLVTKIEDSFWKFSILGTKYVCTQASLIFLGTVSILNAIFVNILGIPS